MIRILALVLSLGLIRAWTRRQCIRGDVQQAYGQVVAATHEPEDKPDEREWRQRVREVSGVLSGMLFGVAATFAASAMVARGAISEYELWAICYGALGIGVIAWSNVGLGRRRRYVLFAIGNFVFMLLAIARAIQDGPNA